jgi:3',5'-cyclic AMP phosphodiesterase CpdA
LVNTSQDNLWEQFFYSGGWILGMMPIVATPGNHEYYRIQGQTPTFSKHWNQIFALPPTGPTEKFNNRVYYYDYQGVRFISIDSPAMQYDEQDSKLILDWLDNVLANNPNRWTIVFTHFPVYNCSLGRDNPEYIQKVRPIYEKYGVDLVLQGHDHTYCRGQNLENAGSEAKNYPVYVVSVAGPKMYGLGTRFWSDRVGSNIQLYQHITIDNDSLVYKSFSVTGDLYDGFTLVKNRDGVNQFIEYEHLDSIQQHTDIPENMKGRYSEEDLLKYNQQYKKGNP